MKNKRAFKNIAIIIILVLIFILFTVIDINKVLSKHIYYINFKNNIKFVINIYNKSLPLLIIGIIFVIYKILSSKWIFSIEKLTLGGISIIFSNPDDLFKQQVRNFLNTKRTLFKFDEEKDNFYETIDSYYQVYSFIREEMKIYDNKSYQNESSCYSEANRMIKKLNEFLTSNQNDYKRWYKYIIETKIEKLHNKDVKEIQMQYRHYEKIVKDFKDVNKVFCSVAEKFDIDLDKW